MHTVAYGSRSGRHGKRPRLPIVSADQFRELREFTGKSREDVADLVGVSLRTVGHWETGATRPTYAAYRLLRVILRGDTLHPGWEAYRFVRGKLVTPEGRAFGPGDLSWLSLLVQRANFQSLRAVAALALKAGGEAAGLGLVPYSTSGTRRAGSEQNRGFQPVAMGPEWGQNGAKQNSPVTVHAQAQSPAPSRPVRRRAAGGDRAARLPEHVHPASRRELRGVHAAGQGQPRSGGGFLNKATGRKAAAGACGTLPRAGVSASVSGGHRRTGESGDGRSRSRRAGGAQGRTQSALPVWEPQEIPALPRRRLRPAGGAA